MSHVCFFGVSLNISLPTVVTVTGLNSKDEALSTLSLIFRMRWRSLYFSTTTSKRFSRWPVVLRRNSLGVI